MVLKNKMKRKERITNKIYIENEVDTSMFKRRKITLKLQCFYEYIHKLVLG